MLWCAKPTEKVKKTLMQNDQLILKNILNYETGQLNTKSTVSFAKSPMQNKRSPMKN